MRAKKMKAEINLLIKKGYIATDNELTPWIILSMTLGFLSST